MPSYAWCCVCESYGARDAEAAETGPAPNAMAAHEEELRRALVPLDAAFQRWRAGDVGSGELAELIHEFHDGPARELFKRYNYGQLDLAVAHAIVAGILDRSRLPGELVEALGRAIAFHEERGQT